MRVRSGVKCPYSGPYFPAYGLKIERYRVLFRIQSKYGKMRARITPNTDTSYAVQVVQLNIVKVIKSFAADIWMLVTCKILRSKYNWSIFCGYLETFLGWVYWNMIESLMFYVQKNFTSCESKQSLTRSTTWL